MQNTHELEPDVRGRIIGCQAQMKTFNFFFGLHLGQRVFSHTDNLSAALQKASLSATDAKHLTNLTVKALKISGMMIASKHSIKPHCARNRSSMQTLENQ
jgi:hypothetical protein